MQGTGRRALDGCSRGSSSSLAGPPHSFMLTSRPFSRPSDLTGSEGGWGQDAGLRELQQGQVVEAGVPQGPPRVQPNLLHAPSLVLAWPPAT